MQGSIEIFFIAKVKEGEKGHPCLVPSPRKKVSLSLLIVTLSEDLFYDVL